ncbi:MAG: sulfur carrier protein ThiS [Negativicutes bacterium]|nr:sulfur carrier protein ThiS [Negativicutes bacterium]
MVVNGEELQISAGMTVEEWLDQRELKSKLIVVEINERILKQEEWGNNVLQAGDRLEIITFVGGG